MQASSTQPAAPALLWLEPCAAVAQTLDSAARTPACASCLTPLGPLPAGLPVLGGFEQPPAALPCLAACGLLFCSRACRGASWHAILCAFGPAERPAVALAAHARATDEAFTLAARCWAQSGAPGGAGALAGLLRCSPGPWPPLAAPGGAGGRGSSLRSLLESQAADAHELLCAALLDARGRGGGGGGSGGGGFAAAAVPDPPSLDAWRLLLGCARAVAAHVEAPSPMARYCSAAAAAPPRAQAAALAGLRPLAAAAAAAAGPGAGAGSGRARRRRRVDDAEIEGEEEGEEVVGTAVAAALRAAPLFEVSSLWGDAATMTAPADAGACAGGGASLLPSPASAPVAAAAALREASAADGVVRLARARVDPSTGVRWGESGARVASALAAAAPRLWPPARGVALAPRAAALPHSCLPTAAAALRLGGADCQAWCAVTALRPQPLSSDCAAGPVAVPSVARVDCGAGSTPRSRSDGLRAAGLLPPSASCACPLCLLQTTGYGEDDDNGDDDGAFDDDAPLPLPSVAAADSALAASRAAALGAPGAGRRLLRRLVAADARALGVDCSAPGGAAHALGTMLIAAGRWREAEVAMRAAAAAGHPAALRHAASRAAFTWWRPNADTAAAAPPPPPLLGPSSPPFLSVRLRPPARGGCGDGSPPRHEAVLSALPLLPAAVCAAVVAEAEAFAAAAGGWATARHAAVPTTDVCLADLPGARAALADALRSAGLAAMLAAAFPDVLPRGAASLRVHDAFVVRYDATDGGDASGCGSSAAAAPPGVPPLRRHLEDHTDEAELSLTVGLSDPACHVGGGTRFALAGGALGAGSGAAVVVVRPGLGAVLAFRGGALCHGGDEVTAGVRHALAVFAYAHDGADNERGDV